MLEWTISKYGRSTNHKILLVKFCFLVFLFSCFFYLSPSFVSAQSQDAFGLEQISETTQLGSDDIRLIIAKIIRAALSLLGIVAIVINLYAGYMIMTSGGNEEKVLKGKKILINGVIGLAIILSAFAITQFVITRLAGATGFAGFGNQGVVSPGGRDTFFGSGALGSVIPDHYPFRDQRDVPRNTKITVTFRQAIDPTSFIIDRNGQNGDGNEIFGDCVNTDQPTFSWDNDCDRVNTDVVRVVLADESDEDPLPIEMVALATREGAEQEIFTVVFRPLALLGNENETDVPYQVTLSSDLLNADGTSVFSQILGGFYSWNFFASNELDITAPRIQSVYPAEGQTVARNTILQINFSEPVDPTLVQGRAGPNSPFYHIIFGDTAIEGEWRVSNGYRTVEFVSDQPCGQNSCGEVMYCLQSACAPNDQSCVEDRRVLIRTAELIERNSTFEAIPFSGVMDLSGNSLDGNANALPDGKPALPTDFQTIRLDPDGDAPYEDAPDNVLWSFRVQNSIDRAAPYIEHVTPGIDAENVPENALHEITFSRVMSIGSLNNLGLEEFGLPDPGQGEDPIDPVWFAPRSRNEGGKTITKLEHRVFGPNNQDAYYFTSIGSEIKSLNQNCVYPGRGPISNTPGAEPNCVYREDDNGTVLENTNCVNVNFNPATDTGCAQTTDETSLLQPDTDACLTNLRTLSPTE